jgi:tagaturonate epimerase
MIPRELLEEVSRAHPGKRVAVLGGSAADIDGASLAMIGIDGSPLLGVSGAESAAPGLETTAEFSAAGQLLRLCPLTHGNAVRLRALLPFAAPSPLAAAAAMPGGTRVTFGVGDRLGIAGPGHIRALREHAVLPVLAQQSVRELTLTGRTFEEVLDASTWAVFQEGYRRPWGADADHVKSEEHVAAAFAAGFTMITADVSDHIRGEHAARPASEVRAAYAGLDASCRAEVERLYLSRSFPLGGGKAVRFPEVTFKKTVLVYRDAVEHAVRLYGAAARAAGPAGFDFELSIDETAAATTPQAHLFVAMEAARRGAVLSSVAPRFPGEFQKGIDYIGDVQEFRASFALHAAVARSLGHRISVHSGSDKFSVFPAIGELSGGSFHIKTAGTSWLEALRVIAAEDPGLFRRVYAAAVQRYGEARRLYHVTPDLAALPAPADIPDGSCGRLLDDVDARRVLHITYGELLGVPALRRELFGVLGARIQAYWSGLQMHLGRHLEALGVPRAETGATV